MVANARKELFGPCVEGLRLQTEIVDVEYRLRVGQVEVAQVVEDSGTRRPEIRDTARDAQTSSGHDDDLGCVAGNGFGDFVDIGADEPKLGIKLSTIQMGS